MKLAPYPFGPHTVSLAPSGSIVGSESAHPGLRGDSVGHGSRLMYRVAASTGAEVPGDSRRLRSSRCRRTAAACAST